MLTRKELEDSKKWYAEHPDMGNAEEVIDSHLSALQRIKELEQEVECLLEDCPPHMRTKGAGE